MIYLKKISPNMEVDLEGYNQELMEEIQKIRKDNIILSDTKKGGYWRPKTIKELMPIYVQTVKKLKENGELYNLIIKERDLIKERGK